MKQIRLCIDAGHGQNNTGNGGFDTGAVAGGMRECDIALAWALTLKHYCVLAQIPVWLTRNDNQDEARLAVRDERAELAGCTHLISIHCNSGTGSATGVETFYRDARDKEWAALVQAAGVSATGLKNRGVKHESDRVPTSRGWRGRLAIFDFDGPAALLETGFISNLKDRSIIAVRETRIKFAEKLRTAILTTRSVADKRIRHGSTVSAPPEGARQIVLRMDDRGRTGQKSRSIRMKQPTGPTGPTWPPVPRCGICARRPVPRGTAH